jgi:hypothetical protein
LIPVLTTVAVILEGGSGGAKFVAEAIPTPMTKVDTVTSTAVTSNFNDARLAISL